MKEAVLDALRASGVFAAIRTANRRKFLIVTYHRFSAQAAAGKTSAAALSEQLRYLQAHYTIVPLSAIERHLVEGDPLPSSSAAITIDDGYRDAYEVAFPILRRYGARATLFAATDFVDGADWLWTDKLRYVETRLPQPGRFSAALLNEELKRVPAGERRLRIAAIARESGVALPASPPPDCQPMTWSQAREMDAAGVEIGSHTVTHPILPLMTGDEIARELHDSRSRLETELDRPVTAFCYPNGDYDARVRYEVERAGYRVAVTTKPGLNGDGTVDPLALERIHTERDLTHFIQSTCGFELLKERLRRASHAAACCISAA